MSTLDEIIDRWIDKQDEFEDKLRRLRLILDDLEKLEEDSQNAEDRFNG